jgi:UDP-sugar transporter A1/2/3
MFLGLAAVTVASILSGFAGIYFEKILKGSAPVSLWMRNVQMSVFALPSSLIASFIQDGWFLREHGFLYGFDAVVWTTVVWYGIGGLSVAVCIKYADNIAKNFATSVAIIISTIASIYIFDFSPTLIFIVGASLVIASIFLYSATAATNGAVGNKR